MNIITTSHGSYGTRTESIEGFISRALDSHGYGSGQLEDINAKADKTAQAIGRLCEILAERRLLNADEVTSIACPIMTNREGAKLTFQSDPATD